MRPLLAANLIESFSILPTGRPGLGRGPRERGLLCAFGSYLTTLVPSGVFGLATGGRPARLDQ
eukprot:4669616-Pyramimonas_sp.AAC.1